MKRRGGTTRRLVIGLAALAIILGGFYLLAVPKIVEAQIVAGLRPLGLTEGYTVERPGVSTIRLRNLVLEPSGVRHGDIGSVDVSYDPASLIGGRVRDVRVSNVKWTVLVEEDGIRWGVPESEAGGGASLADLPFDHVRLDDVRVVFVRERFEFEVVLSAYALAGGGELRGEVEAASDLAEASGSFTIAGSDLAEARVRVLSDVGRSASFFSVFPALKPQQEFEVGGAEIVVAITPGDKNERYRAEVRFAGEQVQVGGMRVASLEGSLALGARMEGDAFTAVLSSPSEVSFGTLALDDEPVIQGVSLRLEPVDGRDLAVLARNEGEWSAQAAFGMESEAPVSFSLAKFSGDAPQAKATVAAAWGRSQPIQVDARMALSDATMSMNADRINLRGIDATAPISIGAEPASDGGERGSFRIAAIVINGNEMPGLEGTVGLHGTRAQFDAVWSLNETSPIRAEGWSDIAEGSGAVTFDRAHVSLEESDLFGLLPEWLVSGEFDGSGGFGWAGGEVTTDLSLDVRDASLRHTDRRTRVTGLDGRIALSGLNPVSTAPARLVFTGGALGDVPITGGRVAIEVESPARLRVTEAHLSLGEYGRFEAAPFAFDPSNAVLPLDLTVQGASLGRWLPLLTDKRVEAEGQLNGRIAFVARPKAQERLIALREGLLSAVPNRGWIQIRDRAAFANLLESQGALTGLDNRTAEVRQQIIDALMNFEFDAFRVSIRQVEGDTALRISTSGRGRTGPNPIPIGGFEINVSGVDEAIALALSLAPQ